MLALVPARATAYELSGGVSVGGILVGTEPHLAVSPHAEISWQAADGFLVSFHELSSILPGTDRLGAGFYSHTAATAGYASGQVLFSIGPSLSLYTIPACGTTLCGRVTGVGAGGYAQLTAHVGRSLGVSVAGSLDWVGGRSLVLPGGLAVMIIAGPVIRWGVK